MDSGHLREVKEVEIAQLHLRYAHTRVEWPERVLALANSMERFGQILPVIVLREGDNSFILIDGYLRVKALKRCLRDTVMAEIWEGKEEEALVEILARANSRKWDLLEEAALLKELHDQYHLSQGRIASMVGRKQSWVSGRLALYGALSEDLLESIRKGINLDLGCHPGDCPYCARNTRACQGAFRESFQSVSVDSGADPLVSSLPEGQSEAERKHRLCPRSLFKSPSCEGGNHRGQKLERGAGGQMAQGFQSDRSSAPRARQGSPYALVSRPVSS